MNLEEILERIEKIENIDQLEEIKKEYLGKKWIITAEFKNLKNLSLEEKKNKWQEL